MKPAFSHEKLHLYEASVAFVAWGTDQLELIPKASSLWDQLDRASGSIPINIAEGNGRFTAPDRCRYFDNARGSALECAACLDVMAARKFAAASGMFAGKERLREIVSMLVGLIRSNSPDRLHEDVQENEIQSADNCDFETPEN